MVVHREGYRWFKLPLFVFVLVSQMLSLSPSVSWAEVAHDCICPFDETILTNPGTQSCGQINCPACGHHLVRALYVGPKPDGVFQNKNTFDQPPTGATGGLTREPRTWVPDPVGGALTIAAGGAPGVPPSNITYTNTIEGVIEISCARCHSGPLRNLMTYENVKVYVDNGLLAMLVRRGGPMNRFAMQDAPVIIDWAKNGAPR